MARARNNGIRRIIHPSVSAGLIEYARKHTADQAHATPSPETVDPIEFLIGRLYNKKDPIHQDPEKLLTISNLLSVDHGYLSAQTAMEGLELKESEHYDEWYMFIRGQLAQARNDAFDDDNFTSSRINAQYVTLTLHKLLRQEPEKRTNIIERGRIAKENLINTIRILVNSDPSYDDSTRGMANELTALACLLSDDVLAQGYISLPSYSWEDDNPNDGYRAKTGQESTNFDISITDITTGLKQPIEFKTSKDDSIVAPPTVKIYGSEVLAETLRQLKIIKPWNHNLHILITEYDDETMRQLLATCGRVILEKINNTAPINRVIRFK